jgi:hypothetical protein
MMLIHKRAADIPGQALLFLFFAFVTYEVEV